MSRLYLVALAILAVAAVVACSNAAAPGWTYAPAPSVTPAPSASGSAGASAGASASASASASAAPPASASPSASASGGPSASASAGAALTITAPSGAATTGFDPKELEGLANTPFTVTFDNQDTTTGPHNWVLKDPNGAKVDIGDTSFTTAPAKTDHSIPALAAGDYPFLCEVHPTTMTGTLHVK